MKLRMKGWIANFMKTTKPKLNVRLLRRVKRHILEEPKRFIMDAVIYRGKPGEYFHSDGDTQVVPDCGTACCIAGWAIKLAGKRINSRGGNLDKAADLLGLDQKGNSRLFLADDWPARFRQRYSNAITAQERAKIAAARIDHLITTGK